MKVRAKELGFYGCLRRKPGTVFVLADESHFSKKWMEKVGSEEAAPAAPEKKKTAKSLDKDKEVI